MKVLILGSDGMVGHVADLYYREHGHDVSGIGERDPALMDFDLLKERIGKERYHAVINCTAIINQDAEKDKVGAVRINTLLPHFLESITAETETVIVHRSTDCIFSGRKGQYGLEDWPDAESFYARSKALGELSNNKDITIRTSLIGPEKEPEGSGLFNWFYRQRGEVNGFANAIWTGLTTIEYARETEWLLENGKHGIFQCVPEGALSKYDLLLLFEKYYPGDRKINRIENARVDKSLVPACGGIRVPGYEDQIREMKDWTEQHRDLYHYN